MEMQLLEDLFAQKLGKALDAEKQLLDALRNMAEAATDPDLAEGFRKHQEETKSQAERLQNIVGKASQSGPMRSATMAAAINEAKELLAQGIDPDLINAALIGAAQLIEGIEIACYSELVQLSQAMRMDTERRVIEGILAEERKMQEQLTALAEDIGFEATSVEERISH